MMKKNYNGRKARKLKPAWNDTQQDLTVHALSKEEARYRKDVFKSKHLESARKELSKKKIPKQKNGESVLVDHIATLLDHYKSTNRSIGYSPFSSPVKSPRFHVSDYHMQAMNYVPQPGPLPSSISANPIAVFPSPMPSPSPIHGNRDIRRRDFLEASLQSNPPNIVETSAILEEIDIKDEIQSFEKQNRRKKINPASKSRGNPIKVTANVVRTNTHPAQEKFVTFEDQQEDRIEEKLSPDDGAYMEQLSVTKSEPYTDHHLDSDDAAKNLMDTKLKEIHLEMNKMKLKFDDIHLSKEMISDCSSKTKMIAGTSQKIVQNVKFLSGKINSIEKDFHEFKDSVSLEMKRILNEMERITHYQQYLMLSLPRLQGGIRTAQELALSGESLKKVSTPDPFKAGLTVQTNERFQQEYHESVGVSNLRSQQNHLETPEPQKLKIKRVENLGPRITTTIGYGQPPSSPMISPSVTSTYDPMDITKGPIVISKM